MLKADDRPPFSAAGLSSVQRERWFIMAYLSWEPFTMNNTTILVFTRNGLGEAPAELQQKLVAKFLQLNLEVNQLPTKILFYTDGVKLACEGSPVVDELKAMKDRGVELILCSTCLDYFGLRDKVRVGIVGGMPDIIEAMSEAAKVISL
jgi:sulfur relay (sulfurtransferase) complex TusBCD TusD component (DsrE family)